MADALRLQMNIRQNAEELQDILQDLNKWEDEMKTKDNELLNSKTVHKQVWVKLVDFTFFCFFNWLRARNSIHRTLSLNYLSLKFVV